jgi:hypothetical protein
MEFYGNYKHLIKEEWIDILLKTLGNTISPFEDPKKINLKKTTASSDNEKSLFLDDGIYGSNLIMCELFDRDNLPFSLDLGELNYLLNGSWWIVKQMPGQYMPIHRDTIHRKEGNRRIWMPLLDYQEGHIFMHEGTFMKDYKAGDMWLYYNDDDLHCCVNLGYTPRIVLQISEHMIT